MKPRMAPLLGRKFLMKSNLELLSKMKWFMSVFLSLPLKLDLFYFRTPSIKVATSLIKLIKMLFHLVHYKLPRYHL
ncbi:hypothetical protein CS538_14750 [Clostridium combesii]|uniref:Uncharacterized protein n=1 Tax=Clostridium combesii TaxID=39481 RepID=A0A2G7HDC7_9CLOT|nr:hypothetical protein CS538_14750 [Clostridium combesii]